MTIEQIPSPNHFDGRAGYSPSWLILHGTAGGTSAANIAGWFANPASQVSAHYVVDQAGDIVQCVQESDAAWANGFLSAGHDSWWNEQINPNYLTIAIEHCKASADNSDALTEVQQAASFALIRDICSRWNIPMRAADSAGGITGHYSIDPINRSRCPGLYPWSQLWAFLGGDMIPQGWQDDGAILTAPNGIKVVRGFRDFVLSNNWDANNYPMEAEHAQQPLELSNQALGNGTQQVFRWSMLGWTPDRGVFEEWIGAELLALRAAVASQPVPPGQDKITAAASTLHAIIAGATAVLSDLGVS